MSAPWLASVRVPALRPGPARAASVYYESPDEALRAHFRAIHAQRMRSLPFLNEAIAVTVADCRRIAGDWLAAVVTPWSIQLVLLPGGGTLWADTPTGARRRVRLPAGEVVFIGAESERGNGIENDSLLPAYQYLPLITALDNVPDTAAAVTMARDALAAAMTAGELATEAIHTAAARTDAGTPSAAPNISVSANIAVPNTVVADLCGQVSPPSSACSRRNFLRLLVPKTKTR
jgi:[NiFe] hydrogenase assembly HybE family chaperone